MLLAIGVLLLLVAAAGIKSGGGGTETWAGSDGDLITEALTEATAGNSTCSNKGCSAVKSSPLPTVIAAGDKVGGGGVRSILAHSSVSSGISSSHTSST